MGAKPEDTKQLPGAWIRYYYNEVALDEKHPDERPSDHQDTDPVAIRFGGWIEAPSGEYVAKISLDALFGSKTSPDRREGAFIGLKFIDRMPIFDFWFQPNIDTGEDPTMRPTLSLSHKGIELQPDKPMWFGKFALQLQGSDGNFVVYDTTFTPWKAVRTMVLVQ